jgi:hypothetical protein
LLLANVPMPSNVDPEGINEQYVCPPINSTSHLDLNLNNGRVHVWLIVVLGWLICSSIQ